MARAVSRILLGLLVAGLALMWSYALFGPRSAPPGTMDDPRFGRAAEPVCAAALAEVLALPPAHETPDRLTRVATIRSADEILLQMIDSVAQIEPAAPPDVRRVEEWLEDWRTFITDRQDYAERLETDEGARFFETAKAGNHISEAIDNFANINHMPSCGDPGDVG